MNEEMKLNIQLFADDENGEEEVETPEEETSEAEEEKSEEPVKEDKKEKSYVKIREDKAREKIFKELGVKDLDEAKTKLANADKALEKVNEIEKKLQAEEKLKEENIKVKELTKILDNEKVFDSEALINYINLDEIELKNNKITSDDAKNIVASLKQLKPNYFGKEFIKSDNYSKSDSKDDKQDVDYKEDYDAGNYQAVIAKYLKNQKK